MSKSTNIVLLDWHMFFEIHTTKGHNSDNERINHNKQRKKTGIKLNWAMNQFDRFGSMQTNRYHKKKLYAYIVMSVLK